MKILIILFLSVILSYILETISICGFANIYGLKLSKLTRLYILLIVIKYNKKKKDQNYEYSRSELLILIKMYYQELNDQDKAILLKLDQEKTGSIISDLIMNKKIVLKKDTL